MQSLSLKYLSARHQLSYLATALVSFGSLSKAEVGTTLQEKPSKQRTSSSEIAAYLGYLPYPPGNEFNQYKKAYFSQAAALGYVVWPRFIYHLSNSKQSIIGGVIYEKAVLTKRYGSGAMKLEFERFAFEGSYRIEGQKLSGYRPIFDAGLWLHAIDDTKISAGSGSHTYRTESSLSPHFAGGIRAPILDNITFETLINLQISSSSLASWWFMTLGGAYAL